MPGSVPHRTPPTHLNARPARHFRDAFPGRWPHTGAVTLILPTALADALWAHARREAPRECVGALGGVQENDTVRTLALYPLGNVASRPEQEYLADPGHLMRALRAMAADGQSLIALYHSHPRGPADPSSTDTRLASYPVPYVIADLRGGTLRAYRLPGGEEVAIVPE